MKKVAINTCFGWFSLSPKWVKRLAELQWKECYFFNTSFANSEMKKTLVPIEEVWDSIFWSAYSVPNPDDYDLCTTDADGKYTTANERAEKITIKTGRIENREDPLLIQVIEELWEEASGRCGSLEIVEIPDDVEYTIEEYDGLEHIAEKHRTWR